MAEAVVVGAVAGDALSKSSSLIIWVIRKTWHFKSELDEMKNAVERMRPIAEQIDKLNNELGGSIHETKRFMSLLNQADVLILKCQKIKYNLWKIFRHALKLGEMNRLLREYVQSDIQLQIARNGVETLVVARRVEKTLEKGSSSGLSCGVPLQKGVVIGFNDRVSDLKAMLLNDSPDDDCSIVVVSAAGGTGKTTFVNFFCNDPEIQERFGPSGENIRYVTVSQNYDPKIVVTKLLGKLPSNTTNEEAIQQWGIFLGRKKSEILLVLDDVWSDKVIRDFKLKLPGYKILVTSRITFRNYKTYEFQLLNNQEATHLFRCSSCPEKNNIPDKLVNKLVKCCKNHPLALSVIGGMLNGARVASWELMLKILSEGKKTLLDMNEDILECLEKSLHLFDNEPEMKQYYMHLGLFPEDKLIHAKIFMDMWAHLYNHDEEGAATMDILDKLSSRNLATLTTKPKGKHLSIAANHCEEEHVMQHDMLRELAIRLINQKPIEQRETLIINLYEEHLPQLPQTSNARVLSMIAGAKSPTWNNIQFPKAEVFVLNFISEMHPLPYFMQEMERLKVLVITHYGFSGSAIKNFPAPQHLSSLTKIIFAFVSISSSCRAILVLENLKKLTFIKCAIYLSFGERIPNKLTSLLEMDIDCCDCFGMFPVVLCDSVRLKKLSINSCSLMYSLPEEIEKLSNLEVLRVATCRDLSTLPDSITKLKKLRTLDLSRCVKLRELPMHIGELDSLETIDVGGCVSLFELPKSIKAFNKLKVVCHEELSQLWRDFKNVIVEVVCHEELPMHIGELDSLEPIEVINYDVKGPLK